MTTPLSAPRAAVSRLTLTKVHHPERTDFTELEQDCVAERAEYQIRKLLAQYDLRAIRTEQAEHLKTVLLGGDAK